jgi:hypothetical protein
VCTDHICRIPEKTQTTLNYGSQGEDIGRPCEDTLEIYTCS